MACWEYFSLCNSAKKNRYALNHTWLSDASSTLPITCDTQLLSKIFPKPSEFDYDEAAKAHAPPPWHCV